ncbi:MAG: hypothetical protein V1861_07055 [Candidatus Micrarchaeota archaeon]
MEDISEKTFELEAETRMKVSESISKIEVALSEWNAAKRKPKKLQKRIEYLQSSYKLLSDWEKDSLKGRRDLPSSVKRLKRFTEICDRLEKGRAK